MKNLNDISAIKNLDRKNALGSINQLPQQIRQAWQEGSFVEIPAGYKNIKNIVISGMGGSSYGGRIVKSLYDGAKKTQIPVELANTYWLPGYVDSNSLVILSSYSGTTKETLTTAKQAKERGAKILGITSGGELADFLKFENYPAYIFDPVHNPSKQPRIGVGYMVTGLLALLTKLGQIPVTLEEINTAVDFLDAENLKLNENAAVSHNPAKKLALILQDKIPVIIVSDFLDGAAYAIRNPFHETAKQFALYFAIPELNHHLLEGLSYPDELKKFLYFIFFESNIYDARNSKRMKLTSEVVIQNHIPTETIVLKGYSALTQVFELIQWGAWVTFYLAMLHDIDPSEIPWVDYFKLKLKNTRGVNSNTP